MNIKKIIKDWMLPIAMVTGASVYLLYHALPEPDEESHFYLNPIFLADLSGSSAGFTDNAAIAI